MLSLLGYGSKPLLLLDLQVMRLRSNQRKIVVSLRLMFHAKLSICARIPIYHLRIVIVALCLYLVAQILLEYVSLVAARLLLLRKSLHHILSGVDVRTLSPLKRFQLILPRRDHGLLGICRTHVIVLVSLGARDSIASIWLRLRIIKLSNLVLVLHLKLRHELGLLP